jgi:PKD repeat protein
MTLTTLNPGVDNQIQVWNTSGQYAGSYQAYVVGVNATVPPFQGFMVHVTNSTVGLPLNQLPTYTFNQTDRVRTPATFYHANDNELTLQVENNSTQLLDKTVVAFNTDATDQFDPQYDANKPSGALNRQTLYSVCNGQWMSRNVLHDMMQTSTVPVGFEPGQTSSFTLTFDGVSTFDPTSYIFLEDKTLGVMHDVRSGAYTFSADSSDNWDRFVLHFSPPASASVTDATCNTNGAINVTQPGTANWNYTLNNSINTTVATGVLNQSNPLNVSEPAGTYNLTLVDNNNYTVTKALQVNGPDMITAAFTCSSNDVQEMQDVILSSSTPNADTYNWDLGNGQTGSGQVITYNYPSAGVYTVVLTVSNLSGCTSSTAQTVTVNANTTTGVMNGSENKPISIWSAENKVYVDFRDQDKVDAVIVIYDVLGRTISNEKFTANLIYTKEIDNIEAAYMIVSVKNNDKVMTRKVFINNYK